MVYIVVYLDPGLGLRACPIIFATEALAAQRASAIATDQKHMAWVMEFPDPRDTLVANDLPGLPQPPSKPDLKLV